MGPDEQAIRDVVAAWHRATAAGDVDAVLALMTDDAIFLGSGRPAMHGRDAFAQALRMLLTTHRVESQFTVREVRVSGDLGYAWSDLVVRIVPAAGGASTARSGSALSIFTRAADGAWRLCRDANLLSSDAGS
jgi:uncharacterized protein (TIGR02246 family)